MFTAYALSEIKFQIMKPESKFNLYVFLFFISFHFTHIQCSYPITTASSFHSVRVGSVRVPINSTVRTNFPN